MREPDIESANLWFDTPAEMWAHMENLYWMENVSIWTEVIRNKSSKYGDDYVVHASYVNPEGRQVDVDAFRPTYHEDTYTCSFDIELED